MTAGTTGGLPDDIGLLPAVHVEGAELDLVELVLAGLLGQAGFVGPVPATDAALPIGLPVPPALAVVVQPGSRVALQDAEGVPVALLTVDETWLDDSGEVVAAGPIAALRPLTHGPFRRARLTPAAVAERLGGRKPYAVTTANPLTAEDLAKIQVAASDSPVLLLALIGSGHHPYPTVVGLVKSLRSLLPHLPADSIVIPVPLPVQPGATAEADDAARSEVARAFGSTDWTHLHRFVDLEAEPELLPADELAVASAYVRPISGRGVVLLFSGLSGSGKSTVAIAVHDALVESTDRTITLLDGDVVRRNLSRGLGFSREDRDINVRRIGFVAAEVARHGGIVVSAPIAPYAKTRSAVRAMVEAAGGILILIHVATPLAVCEARDRKGLYALARQGKILAFTGISDPYEEPNDADLRFDTSEVSVEEAVDLVLDELRRRGLTPSVRREDG